VNRDISHSLFRCKIREQSENSVNNEFVADKRLGVIRFVRANFTM
jgi:hypothetical protein